MSGDEIRHIHLSAELVAQTTSADLRYLVRRLLSDIADEPAREVAARERRAVNEAAALQRENEA